MKVARKIEFEAVLISNKSKSFPVPLLTVWVWCPFYVWFLGLFELEPLFGLGFLIITSVYENHQETAKILNERKYINYLFKSLKFLIWATYFKPLVNMRKSPIWVGSGNDFSKLLLRLKQCPAILQKLEIWIIIERIASGYINWNLKSWGNLKKKNRYKRYTICPHNFSRQQQNKRVDNGLEIGCNIESSHNQHQHHANLYTHWHWTKPWCRSKIYCYGRLPKCRDCTN